MLYSNSYLKKELRQSYSENRISRNRRFLIGIFLSIITISVHMLLQIVYESVLTETFPYLMLRSYFTILNTYNLICYIFFVTYFCKVYNTVTFAEILNNKWYMFTKMGYNVSRMTISKILSSFLVVLTIYSLGYLLVIVEALLLKYNFVYDYFIPLFVYGLISITFIMAFIMLMSLFVKERIRAIVIILSAITVCKFISYIFGYHSLVTDRASMVSLDAMFSSVFTYIILSAILVMLILCFFIAQNKARKYYPTIIKDNNYFIKNFKDDSLQTATSYSEASLTKVTLKIGKILLSVLLILSSIVNVFLLIAALGSKTKEFSVNGVIPYIFQSETMEDDIYKNDIVYFRQIGDDYELNEGDIVIFDNIGTTTISMIVSIQDNNYTTDITNYPELAQKGVMKATVKRNSIYGVYIGSTRVVGAVVLFINTFIGRFLTLILPTILIFFYNPIMEYAKKLKKIMKNKQ